MEILILRQGMATTDKLSLWQNLDVRVYLHVVFILAVEHGFILLEMLCNPCIKWSINQW